ncbi:MAG TPA: protein kinase [Myxococcales bacterium]
MELLAGDRLGKYEVIGRLAAGGMAEVYLARILGHGGFAKAVALKRMLPALAEESGFREMFMQEASLAARLNHPHVVQIFDFAEERGELYLAMEYVHGVNLRQLHADAMKRGAKDPAVRVPPMLAASIAWGVARALAYAWTLPDDKGAPLHLIHRDVSPHNVLLSWQGDVKLADFGIAKPAGALTSVGTLKGKLLYMAPEQLLGGTLDARSDLFALGIVLYETALGHKPIFDGPDQESVKKALQQRVVTPPIRVDPDFPPRLSDVIMKALERDPARRFQSGAEFADALGECLHHEAKSPQEYDLAAFMTRIYGEPQPLRGLNTPEPSSPGLSASPPPTPVCAPDLERVANDGRAETLMRERDRERAADPAAPPSRPTIRGEPPFAEDEWQRRKQRTTVRDRGLPRKEDVQAAIQKVLAEQRAAAVQAQVEAGRPGESRPQAPAALAEAGAEPTRKAVSPAAKWFVVAGACSLLAMGVTWAALGRQETTAPDALAAVEAQPPPPAEPEKVPAPQPAATGSAATAVAPGEPKAEPTAAAPEPPKPEVVAPREPEPKKEPKEEPKPAQPKPAAAEPSPAPAKAVPPVRAPLKRGAGTLVVHVRPWVHAWVDGEPFTGGVDQEAAPRLTRTLASGRHVVHLRDGEGREKTVDVVVNADRQVMIEGTFDGFAVR